MTQIFTATMQTVRIYKLPNNAKAYYIPRLYVGDTAEIVRILVDGVWLEVKAKGVQGFVERRYGVISDTVSEPPPVTGELLWVKGYHDLFGMDYVTRKGILEGNEQQLADVYGLPAAIKLYTTKRIDISKGTATRDLWYELFKGNAPSSVTNINSRFGGMLANGVCYTDAAGGTGFNQIITAPNIVYSMGNPTTFAGRLFRPIRMLKVGSLASMKEQIAKYPHLIHKAKISARGWGGREVIPFWHLNGNDVPVPNFCIDEVNWIEEAWIEPYTGQAQYFPER